MYKSTDGIRANEKEKKLLQSLKYCFKVVLLSQKLL